MYSGTLLSEESCTFRLGCAYVGRLGIDLLTETYVIHGRRVIEIE
jgi:hypothetical protein